MALELLEVSGSRGGRRLFSGVSAGVAHGQLLRVSGANGAGKTTLLRIVAGLAVADRGAVHWRGTPITADRPAFNRQLTYLGHAPALKDELSALENLQSAALLAGRPCTRGEAAAALAAAGLQGRERLAARMLSQGQRRRAALARLALASADGPSLWVLDEPFSALDDAACRWLQGLIAAQLGRGGGVVMTSHERQTWEGAAPHVTLALAAATPAPHAAEAGHSERTAAPEFA